METFFNYSYFFKFQFQPPKSLPHSCDFSQNLTGDGYHTFKLRDKPEWSIGFKKRGKKLPGFIRKPSQEPCHHFSLDLLNPTPITIPFDFNKKKNYLFNNSGKFRIRHKKRKKNRRREKERLRKSQKTRNGVKRWTITWFCLGFQIFELGIFSLTMWCELFSRCTPGNPRTGGDA